MQRKHNILAGIAIALLALLAGCSKSINDPDPTFYDTFPANAPLLVRVKADQLLKAAGCDSKGGSIRLTKSAASSLQWLDSASYPLFEAVAALGNRIDLNNVILVSLADGKFAAITMLRPGTKALGTNATELRGYTPIGDYDGYEIDAESGINAITARDWAWIAQESKERLPVIADSLYDIAKMSAVDDYPDLAKMLKGDAMICGIKNVEIPSNPLGEEFDAIGIEVYVHDRKIKATVQAMWNGIQVDPFSKMGIADASLMTDMPLASIAAAAISLTPESKHWADTIANMAPMPERIFASMIMNWVNPDGGTFAIGLAPGGSAETIRRFSLESWMAKAVLPLPSDRSDMLMDESGVPGTNLFCHTDSTYIYLSNYDSDTNPDGMDMMPDCAADAKAYAALRIPYRSQAMKAWNLKNGYQADAVCSDSTINITLRINGASSYILPALLDDMQRLKN